MTYRMVRAFTNSCRVEGAFRISNKVVDAFRMVVRACSITVVSYQHKCCELSA